MSRETVAIAIKAAIDADTTLSSYIKQCEIVDVIPEAMADYAIFVQNIGYSHDYLDKTSMKYPIVHYTFRLTLNHKSPYLNPALSGSSHTRIYEIADNVEALFKENTLGGILYGDGTVLLPGGIATADNKPIEHRYDINIDCPYVKETDFTNVFVGAGILYYAPKASGQEYSAVSWTAIESCKTPLRVVERYKTEGTAIDSFVLYDTNVPYRPNDIHIHAISPIWEGYFKELSVTSMGLYSNRRTSGNKVFNLRQDASLDSTLMSADIYAFKYEVTMPWGDKLIYFIPSGVMFINNNNERTHFENEMTTLQFNIVPIDNSYYSFEERLGSSVIIT